MNSTSRIMICAALCLVIGVLPVPAVAQQGPTADPPPPAPKAKSSPQIEAGEPRANTSAAAESAAPAVAPPKSTVAPTKSRVPVAGTGPATASQKSAGADRLDLGTATVTGDREQPKVMYIVPWKSSTMGDLAGKPMNSLVDEILAPVDRDVFKREVTYYQAVQADSSQNGASAKPSPQGEK